MLKIAYIGNFRLSYTTENHIASTLEKMGHTVYRCQEDNMSDDDILELVRYKDADLVLYTRTWGIIGNGDWMLDQLQDMGVPTASYHLDLYCGIARGDVNLLKNDPFWHTKYVFTVDGDPKSASTFRKCGINHFYVRAGVYGDECCMAKPDRIKYPHDIVFVGSKDYHKEWPYRPLLIQWLESTYGDRFKRYGNPEPQIRGYDLNALYASAKIVIGDTLCPGFIHEEYWSDRVYETTGRGGFIIHPYICGLEKEFIDREEIIFYPYNDFAQLRHLIDYYLEDDKARESMRHKGFMRTLGSHTYHDRMDEILGVIARYEPKIAEKLPLNEVFA